MPDKSTHQWESTGDLEMGLIDGMMTIIDIIKLHCLKQCSVKSIAELTVLDH